MIDRWKREVLCFGVAAVLSLGILPPRAAFGWSPTCGGTAPPGNVNVTGPFVLNCPTAAVTGCVLTVPATSHLHMFNLVLTCTGTAQTGICLTGTGATLTGPGTVKGCVTGISTSAQGNVVKGVTAKLNDYGIVELPGAAGNGFVLNTVIGNTQNGILTTGGSVKIVNNLALANGIGIRVDGTDTYVNKNKVVNSVGDGILVANATNAFILKNGITNNNVSDNAASAGIHVTTLSTNAKVMHNEGNTNTNSLFNPPFLNFRDDNAGCAGTLWGNNNPSVPPLAYTPGCAN